MKKFTLRVSGARPGSDVRPEGEIVKPLLKQPRFGLKIHSSPLAPKPVMTSDDYASAEDYE